MRRFQPKRCTTALVVSPNSTALRPFVSASHIIQSLGMMAMCIGCFSSWANNIMNVRKFGRWRFRNQIDDPQLAQDFWHARYVGGLFGFLFYWFWAGPRKYWTSDFGDIPTNKRFGPF